MLKPAFYKKINSYLLDLLTQIPKARAGIQTQDTHSLIKNAARKAAARARSPERGGFSWRASAVKVPAGAR